MTAQPEPPKLSRRDASNAMRAKLLACAAQILARDGQAGLTVRRLTAAAAASTKVVYSHFGGMPGVVAALYRQGFAILARQLQEAQNSAPPDEDRHALATAYRTFANESADLFDLMYGRPITILLPTHASRASAEEALDVVVRAFSNTKASDPQDRARAFWAAIHGVVALERGGWFDAEEAKRRLNDVSCHFQTSDR